jgi:hypothetical protein
MKFAIKGSDKDDSRKITFYLELVTTEDILLWGEDESGHKRVFAAVYNSFHDIPTIVAWNNIDGFNAEVRPKEK